MAIITSLRKSTKGTFGKIIMWGMFFIMLGGYGFAGVLLRFFKSGGMQGVALINGIDVSHSYFAQEVDRQKDYFASIRRQFGLFDRLQLCLAS